MGLNLVLNKTTGRIHDVPDDHWALNQAQWPRGRANRNGRLTEVFAEEFEVLDASKYEFSMEDGGWVKKETPSRSRSRSTRTKSEEKS